MKEVLSIDIETRSRLDLSKVGVYKYAENCEVLLFSYSWNDDCIKNGWQSVETIDLYRGEQLPPDIISALVDKDIVKRAYNAQFERIVLSNYLNNYLDPKQWFDTMTLANYLSLPAKLDDIAKFLFPEDTGYHKDSGGSQRLKMFSLPNYRNPDFTKEKDRDYWQDFIRYNKKDVYVECMVHHALSKFFGEVSSKEYGYWVDDQKINDLGVRLDENLVNSVIKILDELSYREVKNFMELTGGLKPSQNVAFAKWLSEETGVHCSSVSKENLKIWYDSLSVVPEKVDKAIKLKSLMGKTSLAKFQKMKDCMCDDGRARGLFQYYGGSRTGRFCLTGDHEILTKNGWKRLDEWDGSEWIAVYNPKGEVISFQKAQANEFDFDGQLYEYDNERMKQLSTPEHKMLMKRTQWSEPEVMTVEDMANIARPYIPLCGERLMRQPHQPIETRVLVMTQADGCYKNEAGLVFSFTKTRKVERCKHLLRRAGIVFTILEYPGKGKDGKLTLYKIVIAYRDLPLYLKIFEDKTFGTWLFNLDPEVFFDELPFWDGYRVTENSIQYSTCNKTNADMVQAFAHMSGRVASIKEKHKNHDKWSTAYVVDLWIKPQQWKAIYKKPNLVDFKGKVYCPTTSTGFFLVRRQGKAWITGNSGRLIQLQNLKRNNLPDIGLWREMACRGSLEELELLTDDVPDVLSQLVRTTIIPREGYEFIVSDFHAIEAVISAWVAGEKWRLEVFRTDGRIYEASASQMFNVPVNTITTPDGKHGENYFLRAKGKVAELALGYGGGVGALEKMGGAKLGLTDEEMRNIVYLWRTKSPRIVEMWNKIDGAMRSIIMGTSQFESITNSINIMRENEHFVSIELPSWRKLYYYEPHFTVKQTPYGVNQQSLVYWGRNQTSGKWEEIDTRGSKLFENIVQAIARDILCRAIHNIRLEHLDVVMHIHDEVVVETPKNTLSVDDINLLMTDLPHWASGMPLTSAGFKTEFYMKD